ncbi:MAG: hypothetical protein AAGE01_12740 [Pseudomonadota bacterium]
MSFFQELKRRNVFRVVTLYLVAGWLVLQVADVLSGVMGLPDWTLRLIALILGLGLLFVVIFAWVYELTPEGVRKASDVDPDASITGQTGRRLNLVIAGLLALAVGLLAIQTLMPGGGPQPEVAAVEAEPAPAPPPMPSMGKGHPADSKPSLAVLPFVNLSSDPEQEYFSDGLAESLLHLLAQVPELQVAARSSSFRFKGQAADIGAISQQLKVAHVLEGSVRRAGSTIRVTAQLVKTDDGFQLWSGTYDRELEDVFAIQDEIAGHVSEALQVALLGKADEPIEARDTALDAYEAYLRGRQQMAVATYESLRQATVYFEQALAIDPEYLDALVSLAETLTLSANAGLFQFDELAVRLGPVLEHFERIAPDSPYVWVIRGYQDFPNGGPYVPETIAQFRRAWEMAPDDTFVAYHYATMLNWGDRPVEAIAVASRALESDPLSEALTMRMGFAHFINAEYEAAARYGRKLRALEPDRPTGFQIVGDAVAELGEFAVSFDAYEESRARDPEDPEGTTNLAVVLLAMNDPALALATIDELPDGKRSLLIPTLTRALIHMRRGELETAVSLLAGPAAENAAPRAWSSFAAALLLVHLYGSGAEIPQEILDWAVASDLESPALDSHGAFWFKLARVPELRRSGRNDLAEAVLAAGREAVQDRGARIEPSMLAIHYAEQDIEGVIALMEEDLADGASSFWWLYYDNAILEFASDDRRYQELLSAYRSHADQQLALHLESERP